MKLVVQSSKKQLLRVVEKETTSLDFELKLLSKSKDELDQELEKFNKKKNVNDRILMAMSEDITFYKKDSQEYIESLETFLEAELIDLQNVIKQRVVSDVRYSFQKNKKKDQKILELKLLLKQQLKMVLLMLFVTTDISLLKSPQTIGEQCEQKIS